VLIVRLSVCVRIFVAVAPCKEYQHAHASCRLSSPVLNADASARARSLLLVDAWNDVATEPAYVADLAGLSSHVALEGGDGIEAAVYGFSDKLPAFAAVLFEVWILRALLCSCVPRRQLTPPAFPCLNRWLL
jgi:secreted Zn-dependent insulinase-like peptidase